MTDFEQFKIQRFGHWDLYLHKNQFPYIGRCYASAIRPDADVVTDISAEEAVELARIVIPSWHTSVAALFGASRPNVAILGNEWQHLHAHLIPRFEGTKKFYGIDFIDPNPTGNYAPYPKKEISLDVLLRIKEDIQKNMA